MKFVIGIVSLVSAIQRAEGSPSGWTVTVQPPSRRHVKPFEGLPPANGLDEVISQQLEDSTV